MKYLIPLVALIFFAPFDSFAITYPRKTFFTANGKDWIVNAYHWVYDGPQNCPYHWWITENPTSLPNCYRFHSTLYCYEGCSETSLRWHTNIAPFSVTQCEEAYNSAVTSCGGEQNVEYVPAETPSICPDFQCKCPLDTFTDCIPTPETTSDNGYYDWDNCHANCTVPDNNQGPPMCR